MTITVRPLATGDIPFTLTRTAAEGWSFERTELARILDHGGGYVVDLEGTPMGVLTVLQYGRLAWIGNVAVAPEARSKGLGEALLRGALADLAARGFTTTGLYSVVKAVSLYRRVGFVEDGLPTEVWGLDLQGSPFQPTDPAIRPARPAEDAARIAKADALVFGADREPLLARLMKDYPSTSFVAERGGLITGYLVAKPSPTGTEIGPAVAFREGDQATMSALLDAALAALLAEGVPSVDVAIRGENRAGLDLLRTRGFTRRFHTIPMYHGAPGHRGAPAHILAVGGLEKG